MANVRKSQANESYKKNLLESLQQVSASLLLTRVAGKRIAGVQIRHFNPSCIDSDLDSVKSVMVRDKIKEFTQLRSKTESNDSKSGNILKSELLDANFS